MSLDIAFALGEMVQAWLTEQMQIPKEPSPTPSDLPSGEATPL
jgi:hypothetical protein